MKIMASGPIISWQTDGEKMETLTDFILQNQCKTCDCSRKIKRALLLGRKAMINTDRALKNGRHHFAGKGPYSQSYGFFSSHVWMWELDYIESWVLKNWWFWTVVLEKTLESTLDCKKTKLVHPKEISPEYSLEGLMWSWSSNPLATWCK